MTTENGTADTCRGRQIAIIGGAGAIGIALSALLVWKVMAAPGSAAAVNRSPDEARLLERAAEAKARAVGQASKLRQHEVGQGIRFDAEGNLIEGTPEGASDLPQNKALDEAASGPPPTDTIAQGIQRRPPRPGAAERDALDPALDDPAAESSESAGAADDDQADRSALTQPMLGYSTVRSASWAARRPEAPEERTREKPRRPASDAREDEAVGKLVRETKALEAEELAAAADPAAGPAMAPAGAGFWTSGAAQGSPGPSARGGALYADTGESPAERGPQMFAAGGVGDMRIGGNVGPDSVVRQGKFLDCVLVTRLHADLVDSPVVAMVSRDFVTLDGKYVLVPAGSKLLGAAGAVGNLQQARVYIKFDRLMFPDQRAAHFPVRKVPAVDGQGSVGVPGDVDRHLMLQFGAAVMLGMLDGLAAAVEAPGTTASPTVRELVTARTSSNLSHVVAGVIQKYANVVPTITVEPGAKMKVFFAEDVRMSPYLTTTELSWVRSRR